MLAHGSAGAHPHANGSTVFVFQPPGKKRAACPRALSQEALELHQEISPHPELPSELEICVFRQAAPEVSAPSAVVAAYQEIGPKVTANGATSEGGATEYVLVVLSDPVAGHDAEYNAWYDHQHVHDVLSEPGFQSAQRYRLTAQPSGPSPRLPHYAVVFRLKTSNFDQTLAEVKRRLVNKITRPSPYFDMKGSITRYYRGEPIAAPDSR
ncbi:DUF4286 family protein [Caulobacter sp. S45]|uniref:DUF4286 family protein n=1 Tax=Caulobacter sp. S45 TaxID=1641861 RepID=UPI00131B2F29|nr:DUF4286 family protein [Caulobacter sp. S45]